MAVDYSRENSQKRLKAIAESINVSLPMDKLQPGTGVGPRVVLVACGSFSPITFMHLRMFEQAKDYCAKNGINVIGGYFSPVTDAYKKKGLVSSEHRIKMCQLATQSSNWIMVDAWESSSPEYLPTLPVLEHFHSCLNKNLKEGEEPIRVLLLCGGDLLDSINTPGVWAPEDVRDILTKFGLVVLERAGTSAMDDLYANDILYEYQKNVHIIKQWIVNDISSTKVRQMISRGGSIKYLTENAVIEYIQEQKLYSA